MGWHGKVYPQPFSTVQWLVACAYWYSLPLTTQGLNVQWLVVCAYQHSLPLTTQGLTVQCLVACAYLKWSKTGHRKALGTRLDGKAIHGAICRTKIEAKRAFVQTSISCLHSTFIHLPSPLICSVGMCVLILEGFPYDNFVYVNIVGLCSVYHAVSLHFQSASITQLRKGTHNLTTLWFDGLHTIYGSLNYSQNLHTTKTKILF